MKIREWLRGFISPRPTLFDLSLVGMLFIGFIRNIFYQGTFFIFYSILILVLTMFLKPKREYRSIPLALFILWSLVMVFTHKNIEVVPNSIMNYYFNVSIMFEGFIYILFGGLLFYNIIRYSTNLKFMLLLLPVALCPFYGSYSFSGRITPLAALGVSILIYLFLKKKYLIGLLGTSFAALLTYINWHYIMFKFQCRPLVWIELLRQIEEHPWIGSGFNHTLSPNNMTWVREIQGIVYGWVYRHNDLLSIGTYLGIFALICVALFIIQSIRKIGVSLWLIPFLTIFIMSCFQMTFFLPDKAAIALVLCAVAIKESEKIKSNCSQANFQERG